MKNLVSTSLISFVGAFYEKIENDPRARPGAGSLVCNTIFTRHIIHNVVSLYHQQSDCKKHKKIFCEVSPK